VATHLSVNKVPDRWTRGNRLDADIDSDVVEGIIEAQAANTGK